MAFIDKKVSALTRINSLSNIAQADLIVNDNTQAQDIDKTRLMSVEDFKGQLSISEVPSGGTQGQILTKGSTEPEWADASGGGGSAGFSLLAEHINNTASNQVITFTNLNIPSKSVIKVVGKSYQSTNGIIDSVLINGGSDSGTGFGANNDIAGTVINGNPANFSDLSASPRQYYSLFGSILSGVFNEAIIVLDNGTCDVYNEMKYLGSRALGSGQYQWGKADSIFNISVSSVASGINTLQFTLKPYTSIHLYM